MSKMMYRCLPKGTVYVEKQSPFRLKGHSSPDIMAMIVAGTPFDNGHFQIYFKIYLTWAMLLLSEIMRYFFMKAPSKYLQNGHKITTKFSALRLIPISDIF